GLNEIFSILAGGIFGGLFIYISEKMENTNNLNSFSLFSLSLIGLISPLTQYADKAEVSLTTLFLTCLKIGAVWFGGGYILVAYFDGEFVKGLNWLTRQELLDAIAVGQFTPGPFLSSATFIGYQIAGMTGALSATIGIMIPSFIFVAILNPSVKHIRKSIYLSKFLDAVNVSALAAMVVVSLQLAIEVLIDTPDGINWQGWVIFILSLAAYFGIRKMNAAYIIIGSAALGYLLYLIGK